jgi:hypothetical protein
MYKKKESFVLLTPIEKEKIQKVFRMFRLKKSPFTLFKKISIQKKTKQEG